MLELKYLLSAAAIGSLFLSPVAVPGAYADEYCDDECSSGGDDGSDGGGDGGGDGGAVCTSKVVVVREIKTLTTGETCWGFYNNCGEQLYTSGSGCLD
jgi:hypothetical protein